MELKCHLHTEPFLKIPSFSIPAPTSPVIRLVTAVSSIFIRYQIVEHVNCPLLHAATHHRNFQNSNRFLVDYTHISLKRKILNFLHHILTSKY